jgi:PAS domain S-box-containing protein
MITLLYVDDEFEILKMTRAYLERSGEFSVTTCTSAPRALESSFITQCDAIVSDYLMPDMDGIAFLKAVRARNIDVPFILFTGRGREEVVIEAINNGADFYLQKGGDPRAQFAELAHKIRQSLSKRQVETALIESEKRLGDIINFLPDATFAIDRYGKVIAWNRSIEEMTGTPASAMIGRGDYEYAVPFYGDRRPLLIDLVFESDRLIEDRYDDVVRQGDRLIADTNLPRPKGQEVTLRGMASPLYDRQGRVVGAIESVRDITDLKRVADELRRSEEKYRLAAEVSGQLVYDCDLQTGTTRWGGAIASVTGYVPEEEEDRSFSCWAERIHPDDREKLDGILREAMQQGGRYRVEYRFRRPDGTYIPLEDSGGIVLDGAGRAVRMIGTQVDLSKRKEGEAALRLSEEKFRGLVERISDIVLLLERDFTVSYASPSFEALEGIDQRPLVHRLLPLEILDESDRGVFVEVLERIRELETVGPFEISLPAAAKERLVFELRGTPIQRDGVFDGALLVGHDVTALRSVQNELQAAHEELLAVEEELREQLEALKRSEREVSENESRFRAIFEHSPYAISITNSVGAYLAVNPAFEKDTGYSAVSAIGKNPVQLGLMSGEIYQRIGWELMRNGKVDRFPFTSVRSDGRQGAVLISCIFISYDNRPAVLSIVIDIADRVQAQEALREKSEELDRFFSMSRDLFCIADIDGLFQRLNYEWESTLGYSPTELEGSRFLDFVHPDDLSATRAVFADLAQQKPVLNFTVRFRHRDRTYRRMEWRFFPKGHQVFAAARDVTQRLMQIERTARISALKQELIGGGRLEEKLRRIADCMEDLFEKHFARIWLIGPENLLDPGPNRRIVSDDPPVRPHPDSCLHLAIATSGDALPVDDCRHLRWGSAETVRIARGDETSFLTNDLSHDPRVPDREWAAPRGLVSFAGFRLVDMEGEAIGVLEVFSAQPLSSSDFEYLQDIAALSSQVVQTGIMEEALLESEQRYRSIIENVEDGFIRSDRDGRTIMASPSAAAALGYDAVDNLLALPAGAFFQSEDTWEAIRSRVTEQGNVRDLEVRLTRKDGSRFWASLNAHVLGDPEGSILGIEGFFRDVTERKKMESAVREANRKLNLLNSITRHDVVNQLTVLQGYVDLASAEPGAPEMTAYLDHIGEAADKIARQIEFTRTYQELGVRAPAWIRIDEIVARTAILPTDLSDRCRGLEVFADSMLEQVFANLFDNSIRHGGRVTRIAIRCEECPEGMIVHVEDDGVGIPSRDKERIFQKGYGLNTGLGLFLVREILSITGVSIRENSIPAHGARFEMLFPPGSFRTALDS